MTRRTLCSSLAAVSAVGAMPATAAGRLPIKKAVLVGMLPKTMSYADRFKLAQDCGFQAVEGQTVPDQKEAEEIKKASDTVKIPIHSVMNMDHWQYPLSSPEPDVVNRSLKGMETSLRNAKLWGADTVLLVPGVVNGKVGYQDAWTRSQTEIRKLVPLATELKVNIGIENVWNKFLLSPLEMARYVDDFKSPYVRSYFDVGNVWLYGYSQDWIRTLGKRICKIHLKDFSFKNDPQTKKRAVEWNNLREGEIDWKAIYEALAAIGYNGYATVELIGGDGAYLAEVSRRVDLIFEGA